VSAFLFVAAEIDGKSAVASMGRHVRRPLDAGSDAYWIRLAWMAQPVVHETAFDILELSTNSTLALLTNADTDDTSDDLLPHRNDVVPDRAYARGLERLALAVSDAVDLLLGAGARSVNVVYGFGSGGLKTDFDFVEVGRVNLLGFIVGLFWERGVLTRDICISVASAPCDLE
jgi:hypothetical protein